jgi:hypothetical protein
MANDDSKSPLPKVGDTVSLPGEDASQYEVLALRPGEVRVASLRSGRTKWVGEDALRAAPADTAPAAGPLPKVTGYAKGREVEAGMLINAADLLPMHESQGNTTGENPNPLGHADWVRVGLVGNTNTPEYRSYNSNRSLTGGMYVVFDQAGHPVGRMSANTIAEVNTADNQPKAALDIVRMPVKVKVKVNDGFGKSHIEERDGFEMAHVPSAFAQKEAGMPAPKMLRDGILDPSDPNYGKDARRPKPANRPHGPVVQGSRTREQYRADRKQRDAAYAASEPERAARRAEREAQRKADAAVTRQLEQAEAERKAAIAREQYRRDTITRRHNRILEDLASDNASVYDPKSGTVVPSTAEEMAAFSLTRGSSDLRWLAAAYGINARKMTLQEQSQAIAAAVKAGKTPDLEVGAPKVLGEAEQAAAEAKKIATADKRRRTTITKAIDALKAEIRTNDTYPTALEYLGDNGLRQVAEAFHLGGMVGLSNRALREAIKEAVRNGQVPDLDAAPIASLKKSRR